jgi:hypothetical protein
MTSAPVRVPLADHLLAPQNAALLFTGYQPAPLSGSARWTARCWSRTPSRRSRPSKPVGVPVVRSTVNDASGRDSPPSPTSPAAYQLDHLPSQQEVLAIAENRRPFRSLATSYLFSAAFEPAEAPPVPRLRSA